MRTGDCLRKSTACLEEDLGRHGERAHLGRELVPLDLTNSLNRISGVFQLLEAAIEG